METKRFELSQALKEREDVLLNASGKPPGINTVHLFKNGIDHHYSLEDLYQVDRKIMYIILGKPACCNYEGGDYRNSSHSDYEGEGYRDLKFFQGCAVEVSEVWSYRDLCSKHAQYQLELEGKRNELNILERDFMIATRNQLNGTCIFKGFCIPVNQAEKMYKNQASCIVKDIGTFMSQSSFKFKDFQVGLYNLFWRINKTMFKEMKLVEKIIAGLTYNEMVSPSETTYSNLFHHYKRMSVLSNIKEEVEKKMQMKKSISKV